MEYRLGPTLLSAAEIRARVRELAQAISRDYAGRDLLLICVLKGAAIFWADLCRALQIPCQSDFVAMESYSDATAPLGKPRFTKAAGVSLEDRDVLIVEDIIDTGHTIVHLRQSPPGAIPPDRRTLRTLGQGRATGDPDPDRVLRVRHPERLRGGVRSGPRPALPTPASHRDTGARSRHVTAPSRAGAGRGVGCRPGARDRPRQRRAGAGEARLARTAVRRRPAGVRNAMFPVVFRVVSW